MSPTRLAQVVVAGDDPKPWSEGRLLAPRQVAELLAVSVSMIYKLLRVGKLRAIYVGRLPRIASDDLHGYIECQREAGR